MGLEKKVAPAKFEAEAGKVYFFEVTPGFWGTVDIEPVDEKEGRERVSGYTLSGDNVFEYEMELQK